jgi:hypothetical protein
MARFRLVCATLLLPMVEAAAPVPEAELPFDPSANRSKR